GGGGFISVAEGPRYDEAKVDVRAEEVESLVKSLIDDTWSIIKVMKMSPKKIHYYVAAGWKWKAYRKLLELSSQKKIDMREAMRALMEDSELRDVAKDLAPFVSQVISEVNTLPAERKHRLLEAGIIDEIGEISEARGFFGKEFNAEVVVYREDDPQKYDPKGKARQAKPYRPAIYIE
ncbi:MAG: hypothetical protein QXV74_02505, partial [Candidatus Bathyarchaeia archaeon]